MTGFSGIDIARLKDKQNFSVMSCRRVIKSIQYAANSDKFSFFLVMCLLSFTFVEESIVEEIFIGIIKKS